MVQVQGSEVQDKGGGCRNRKERMCVVIEEISLICDFVSEDLLETKERKESGWHYNKNLMTASLVF